MLVDLALLSFATLMFYTLAYLGAMLRHRIAFVPHVWVVGFAALSVMGLGYSQFGIRQFVVFLLMMLWFIRLTLPLLHRDGHNTRPPAKWGRWWVVRAYLDRYLRLWLLQLLIAIPLLAVMLTPTSSFWLLDYLGAILALAALLLSRRLGPWRDPLFWVGIAVLAFAQTNNLFVFAGPLLLSYLSSRSRAGSLPLDHK